jgi:hypothetical protein
MEPTDAYAARDLLVDERKSRDVLREAIAAELRAGRTPVELLAEVPTLSERLVREAMATMIPDAPPRRGHLLGCTL